MSMFQPAEDVTSRSHELLALGLLDLSDQLTTLGDAPFAHGVWSSIWLCELADGQVVAAKAFDPARVIVGDVVGSFRA